MEKRTSPPAEKLSPWNSPRVRANHRNRKIVDIVVKVLAVACLVAVLVPLGDMLYMFAYRGLEVLTIPRLVDGTGSLVPGLSNAIVGTAIITSMSAAIAIPLGLFGGIYMAEFAKGGRFASGLRFTADVLAGVPSIILGYTGYVIFVIYFGFGFSILAAAIILSIVMFPYIFRTTEIALLKVPLNIKEGATALGSTKTTTINRLVLRFALPGIMTGIILSIGIALSETAPLLYTAGFGSFNPSGLQHWFVQWPVAYLTGVIWTFYQSPLQADVQLAYLSTFLLILIVLVLNVVARVGLQRFSKV
jgi:phosphate transport system permease protein